MLSFQSLLSLDLTPFFRKGKRLFQPLRVAVTGSMSGPDIVQQLVDEMAAVGEPLTVGLARCERECTEEEVENQVAEVISRCDIHIL